MAQTVLHEPSFLRAPQEAVIRRAALAALTALVVLLVIGADNRIVLTVLPSFAALVALVVDAFNLRRAERGQAPLAHRWCAAILGASVLASALVVFSAT